MAVTLQYTTSTGEKGENYQSGHGNTQRLPVHRYVDARTRRLPCGIAWYGIVIGPLHRQKGRMGV